MLFQHNLENKKCPKSLVLEHPMNPNNRFFFFFFHFYLLRLDRLFVLLETGSTPYTRQAAATQLGEVTQFHPHELHHLLHRIYRLLSSSSWETRLAAAQAVAAVVKHTPPWEPIPGGKCGKQSNMLQINYVLGSMFYRKTHTNV